jgi:hypothetical protein
MERVRSLLFCKVVLWLGAFLVTGVSAKSAVLKYSDVHIASDAFIGSLSPEQKGMAVVAYNQSNAVKWTNLPCGLQCRVGILLGSLSATQLMLAKKVAKAALGASPGAGYDQVMGTERSILQITTSLLSWEYQMRKASGSYKLADTTWR